MLAYRKITTPQRRSFFFPKPPPVGVLMMMVSPASSTVWSELFSRSNLPLFRRIFDHPDFQAARIDTGFLDRLLVSAANESDSTLDSLTNIAALSAVFFSATSNVKLNGQNAKLGSNSSCPASQWKRTARTEGVRSE